MSERVGVRASVCAVGGPTLKTAELVMPLRPLPSVSGCERHQPASPHQQAQRNGIRQHRHLGLLRARTQEGVCTCDKRGLSAARAAQHARAGLESHGQPPRNRCCARYCERPMSAQPGPGPGPKQADVRV